VEAAEMIETDAIHICFMWIATLLTSYAEIDNWSFNGDSPWSTIWR